MTRRLGAFAGLGAAPGVPTGATFRTPRTTIAAHTVLARRRRLPTTIPAVEEVLDG